MDKWGTEEVAAWLDVLGLGEYKEIFVRHDIQGSELVLLERRDLKVFCKGIKSPSATVSLPHRQLMIFMFYKLLEPLHFIKYTVIKLLERLGQFLEY